MTTFFLIRHAHAGERHAWKGDDSERPLSDRGRTQARGMADALAGTPVGRIYSSPARRCIETVEPLAGDVGKEVQVRTELREGADPGKLIAFMEDHAGKKAVALCGHGDVIPFVIELLHHRGMVVDGEVGTRKGSWWTIEHDGEQFTRATWHPPVRPD
jgi:8-oxo-dGTP diphosphatase